MTVKCKGVVAREGEIAGQTRWTKPRGSTAAKSPSGRTGGCRTPHESPFSGWGRHAESPRPCERAHCADGTPSPKIAALTAIGRQLCTRGRTR